MLPTCSDPSHAPALGCFFFQVDSRGTHALVSFNLSEVPEPPASAAVGEPSDEDVKASVQRLGKLVCDKLPQTHLPSLTKSTLSLVQARWDALSIPDLSALALLQP